MYKMPTLEGLKDQAVRRFKLPQFSSPSSSINQANSDVMQSSVQTPANGDIFSSAKQGVEKIKTGIAAKQSTDPGMFEFPESFTQRTSPTPSVQPVGNGSLDVQQDETPETQVGKPQPKVRTGIGMDRQGQAAGMVNDVAGVMSGGDIDALRAATQRQQQATDALAGFDPSSVPVSKKRKAAGIASGIASGVLGGGVRGGMQTYDLVTGAPARAQQQQLAKEQAAATSGVAGQEKVGQAVGKYADTGLKAADTMSKIGTETSKDEQYEDTGRDDVLARTGLNNATANKTKSDMNKGLVVNKGDTYFPKGQEPTSKFTAPVAEDAPSLQHVAIEDPINPKKPIIGRFNPKTGDVTGPDGKIVEFPRPYYKDGQDALSMYQKSQGFERISTRYQADPIMRISTEGATAKRLADQIIADPKSATNQLASLYIFVKNLDPKSTVRESETALAKQTQSVFDSWQVYADRLSQGALLSPEATKDLANATKDLIKAWDESARDRTKQYNAQAEVAGVGSEFKKYLDSFKEIGGKEGKVTVNIPGVGNQEFPSQQDADAAMEKINALGKKPAVKSTTKGK